MKKRWSNGESLRIMALVLFPMLLVWGCATTLDARKADQSGFLGEYSKLKQVKEGEALEVYWNPGVDFSTYNKLILEKIQVMCCSEHKLREPSPEELDRLSLEFRNAMKSRLGRYYQIVDEPGPGVMRLYPALTEAKKSVVPLDMITTLYPSARVLSEIKKVTTGTEAFVGSASVEIKLTDSTTDEVLFEEIDRRGGGKSVEKWSTNSLHDVELIFDYWADHLDQGLREKRTHLQQSAQAVIP